MGKTFLEVFPTLKLNKRLHTMLENTTVERVTSNRQKDFLRVYLYSDHLLEKELVLETEKEIVNQLFPHERIQLKIQEKFSLSGQYNLENLIKIYRKSILLELEQYNHVLYSMVKHGEFSYPGENRLELILPDTVLYQDKAEELISILEKILVERCGMHAAISLTFYEKEEGDYGREDRERIRQQVAAISRRAESAAEGQSAEADEDNPGQPTREEKRGEKAAAPAGKTDKADFSSKEKGRFQRPARGEGRDFKRAMKRSDNPDVIYGRDFEDEAMPIMDIIGEMGEVTIRGQIIALDTREIRNEKTIVIFDLTDFTDTMTIKLFTRNDQLGELLTELKKGAFVKLKGLSTLDKFDGELTIGSLVGVKKIKNFTTERMDISTQKRVELHCHTKMSDMDGVSDVKAIIKRAYRWGHPAIAITDHGVVQSFPEANHVWEDLWKEEKAKRKAAGEENPSPDDFFKIIYGMEAYLVDDLK